MTADSVMLWGYELFLLYVTFWNEFFSPGNCQHPSFINLVSYKMVKEALIFWIASIHFYIFKLVKDNNFLPCFLTCWCLMTTQIHRSLKASFWVLYFFNIPLNTVSFDLLLNQSHTGCGSLHNSERFKLKVQGFCRTVFHWVFCTVWL